MTVAQATRKRRTSWNIADNLARTYWQSRWYYRPIRGGRRRRRKMRMRVHTHTGVYMTNYIFSMKFPRQCLAYDAYLFAIVFVWGSSLISITKFSSLMFLFYSWYHRNTLLQHYFKTFPVNISFYLFPCILTIISSLSSYSLLYFYCLYNRVRVCEREMAVMKKEG